MYNTKFILEDGKELYPGYLDREQRKLIKEKYKEEREYMHCGCKTTNKLFYRISEDLKIYPEHKNYIHDVYCCRYKDELGNSSRQTAYVINDDDGEVTVYTSFDPKIFSNDEEVEKEYDNVVPEDSEEMLEEIIVGQDEDLLEKKERKEPKLSLDGLIRSINVDSFTEKVLNNRPIETIEKFSTYVYYRMKKVRLSRTKKSMGDLSLEKDGVRFVYLPYEGAVENTDKGYTRCYLQTKAEGGKIFNNFIFPETMEKALKKFDKQYGIEPNEHTVMAGFQYLKKNKANSAYKVMGRVHLFQVSDIGLYCRTMTECNVFNELHRIVKEDDNIRFWIPPEDENVGAIIGIKGKEKKILLIFKGKKSERVSYDPEIYVPLVVDNATVISKEMLYDIVDAKI